MRRGLPFFVLLVLPAFMAVAVPKVAVLSASIPDSMNKAVAVPVTDKVVEQLVESGNFLVLDRANVEAVLKEREFQYSGMVSDQEISQAGKYLGAELVVVIRVELIGDTYFVSSRMINVESGIIARQSSAQGEGKLAVLLDLAAEVGANLVANGGGQQPPAPAQRQRTAPTPAPAAEQPVRTPPAKAAGSPSVSEQIGFRLYFGAGQGSLVINDSEPFDTPAVDVYMLAPLEGIWCMTFNLTYFDGPADFDFASTSIDLGIGLALPLGPIMLWGAGKFGVAVLELEDYTGFEGGFDVGVDFRMDTFVIGVRYQVLSASYESATYLDTFDTTTDATIFMIGFKM